MTMSHLTIGTRGSPLALSQARRVEDALKRVWPGSKIQIRSIVTSGDRMQDRSLLDIGGKGLFVKEIEESLLAGDIDIAVHSVKDMPADIPSGLLMDTFLRREEYRDALVSNGVPLAELRQQAVIGSSSLRRSSQALQVRRDFVFKECRGNVETRLKKLKRGDYDALILSAAGLERLGLENNITEYLDWIPAVGQGVIGIECRSDDDGIQALLQPIHDESTALCVRAERAFMKALNGNCRLALGCLAQLETEETLRLKGFWVNPDNAHYSEGTLTGPLAQAEDLGKALAEQLRTRD